MKKLMVNELEQAKGEQMLTFSSFNAADTLTDRSVSTRIIGIHFVCHGLMPFLFYVYMFGHIFS